MALSSDKIHSTVVLSGKLCRVFPLLPETLGPVARVLAKIKMPEKAGRIKKKLKFRPEDLRMLTTGKQLHDVGALHNWRVLPVQFGLPSPSQILSELIRAADFEVIAYQSTKGGGMCMAVFVDRLDEATAEELAGWTQLGLKPPKA